MDIDASTNDAPITNGIDSNQSKESVTAVSSVQQILDDEIAAVESDAVASKDNVGVETVSTVAASDAPAESTSIEMTKEIETEPALEANTAAEVVKEAGPSDTDGQQTTILEIKTEQVDKEDEEEDMNVGSDDEFDTPPPKEQAAAIKAETDSPATEIASQPLPPAPVPSNIAAVPEVASAVKAANEEAASAFLKQTFDSLNKTNGAGPSSAMIQNDLAAYRESLLARIEKDKRDGEAWLALISDTNSRGDLQEMRKGYEDFFVVYPNAVRLLVALILFSCLLFSLQARQWQDYANLELANSEFEKVESIFTRCLRSTPSTDLWRLYLSYTRRVNPLPPPSKSSANGEESEREKVRKLIEGAYDFALRFIGQSRDAGEVWRDYISLLKEREASNQWQAGQKMDDIRRAYQRAVSVPLANVELIWREYDAYENGLNRLTAKKFLAERSPAYMTARTVFREMKTLTDGLYRPLITKVPCWAVPPSLSPIVSPLTINRDRSQVEAWKKYLLWEEENPLQLEDLQTLQGRILVSYRKATMHLRFFPEIWYMAYVYCHKIGRLDEAATWLKSGMEACAGSYLLHFAYVELSEARSQVQDCGEVFQSLVEWTYAQIDSLQANLEESFKALDEEMEQIKAEASARRRDEGAADLIGGEEREELRKMDEERQRRKDAESEKVRPKVEELRESASLVWIKYMHFVRRQEGQRPSRAIFARARKSKHCTWQVFEANALMEYHCSKEVSVATKVFELALKTYGDDEAFVVRYLDFLLSINDDNNARALFERTVGTFPAERARPIWDRWSEYEYSFGDSASIAKIDERLAQVYPDEMPIKRLVDRNSYMDLDVVGPRDLGLRTVIGGASAAERAVAASREIAQEAAGSAMMSTIPTGPSIRMYQGEDEQQGAVKRARFGDSPIIPGARAVPPPRGMKRSVSPPSRFVPPPRGEPSTAGPPAALAHQQQQQRASPQPPPPQYIEIPDGVMYFLDCLPSAAVFDGPRFPAEDIIESLLRSSLPLYDFSKAPAQNGSNGAAGYGPARGGGGGRSRRCEFNFVDVMRMC
jgi:cleavage stimulation factor subunit 3